MAVLGGIPTLAAAGENSSKQATTLETVTVTAQKTEENVQDVPISITVLDGLEIEDRKIEKVTDIALATPNLFFVDTNFGGWSFPVIRGLGNNFTWSSPVTMFVDGLEWLLSQNRRQGTKNEPATGHNPSFYLEGQEF